jgi:hypothetical protein
MARPASRRRLRRLRVIRGRVTFEAFALVTGLPAALAVLAPLPPGLLPVLLLPRLAGRLAPMPSFDDGVPESLPSMDRRRSSSATRKFQAALPRQHSPDLRLQHRDLLVLRRNDGTQPLHERLLTGLIGHEPEACST